MIAHPQLPMNTHNTHDLIAPQLFPTTHYALFEDMDQSIFERTHTYTHTDTISVDINETTRI